MSLPEKWITHLVGERETGMGYQVCRITDKNGIHEGVIVYNCGEDMEDASEVDPESITDIEVTH